MVQESSSGKFLFCSNLFFFISVFSLWILNSNFLFGQEKKIKQIELLNANSLEYDETLGTRAKRLIGNVALKHEGTTMYCDSAHLFSEENRFDAFGHVHIKPQGTSDLYGDSMRYYGNTKLANIRGLVRLTDKDHTLQTTSLDYNVENDLASYTNGGTIINSNDSSTLTSTYGYFYPNRNEFFFKKKVKVVHPDYEINSDTLKYNTQTRITVFLGPSTIRGNDNFIYCENGLHDSQSNISRFGKNAYMENGSQKLKGDSIIYDRNLSIGKVIGNVLITDTADDIEITGDLLIHYETDSITIITGKTMLTQFYATDTLYLHADTLFTRYDSVPGNDNQEKEKTKLKSQKNLISAGNDTVTSSKKRLMLAYHHVKFFKTDMQGKCDSLVFSDSDSTIKMFRSPVIWSSENQMTADYIEISTFSGEVKSMVFDNNAFIISVVQGAEFPTSDTQKTQLNSLNLLNDSQLLFNQIKGEKMVGHFDSSKLVMIDVMQKGQTVYYAKDDSPGEKEDTLQTDSPDSIASDTLQKNENGDGIIGVNIADCDSMVIHVKDNKVRKISFRGKINAALHPLNKITYSETILDGFSWKEKWRPKKKEDIFIEELK